MSMPIEQSKASAIRSPRADLTRYFAIVVLLVLVSTAALFIFSVMHNAPIIFVVYVVLGGLGTLINSRSSDNNEVLIFLVTLSWNVIIAIVIYMLYLGRYGDPYFVGGSDDLFFETVAAQLAPRIGDIGWSSMPRLLGVSSDVNYLGYVYLLAWLRRIAELLGQYHTLAPRILNSVLLAQLSTLVFRIARDHLELKRLTATVSGLFAGVAPLMSFVAAHVFRDILIALLITASLYVWGEYLSQRKSLLFATLATCLSALIVWQLRRFATVAILGIAYLTIFESIRTRKRALSILWLFFGIFLPLILLVSQPVTESWFLERIFFLYDHYTDYRLELSQGLASYVFGAPEPLSILLRLAYQSITPLPILSLQPERMWISIGTLLQFIALPLLFTGLFSIAHARIHFGLWISFLLIYCGVAILSFQTRQIVMYYPLAILIAGYGHGRLKNGLPVKEIWLIWYWVGLFMLITYITLTFWIV